MLYTFCKLECTLFIEICLNMCLVFWERETVPLKFILRVLLTSSLCRTMAALIFSFIFLEVQIGYMT